MKTKKMKPYWSIRIAIFIFMLPLYGLVFFRNRYGVFDMFGMSGDLSTAGKWILVAVAASFLVSLFLLFRTGKLALPMLFLFLCILPMQLCQAIFTKIDRSVPNKYFLTVGKRDCVTGTEVYCNGVFLGKTPLKIADDEFYEKVKPWDKPPRQKMTSIREDTLSESEFKDAYLYWVPNDPFGNHADYPRGEIKRPLRNGSTNEKIFKVIKDIKYWWHFKNSGYSGITLATSYSSGAGSSGNVITIDVTPRIGYPALNKHFPILVESLKRSNYQPSEQWLDHFQKYQNLMFLKFYNYVKENPQAADALDAVVRHQFNIGTEISRKDCVRVLDEIMARLEKAGRFTLPSIELLAAEMVCPEHKDVISEYYIESLKWAYPILVWSRSNGIITHRRDSWGRSNGIMTYRRDGKGIRKDLMEHLVNKYQPEGLFNRLVYEAVDHQDSICLAVNYPRKESFDIFNQYLHEVERSSKSRHGSDHNVDEAVRQFEYISNPDLQDRMMEFISVNSGGSSFWLRRFFDRQIKNNPQDRRLPELISSSKVISKHDKARYVAKLRTDTVSNYLQHLSSIDPSNRRIALKKLGKSPNSFADEFLIDSFRFYMRSDNEGKWLRDWVKAAVGSNSPKMGEFITGVFEKGGKERDRLLKEMAPRWYNPAMDWLIPMLEKVEGGDQRYHAASILGNIGSERAVEILETWSRDSNEKIAQNASYQLGWAKRHKNRTVVTPDRRDFDQKTIDGVISGRIKPDDLLDEAVVLAWDGEKYIEE